MIEIFLSYSHQDIDRVKRIAEALAAEGFTIWWDRKIEAGKDYQEAIEGALRGAKCTIVLWSDASVASQWVRSEASEAQELETLLPVLINANARLPIAFKLVQTENLSDWTGDRQAESWRRVVLQAGALCGRNAPPSSLAEPIGESPQPRAPESRSTTMLLLAIAAAALIAAWIWPPTLTGGPFATIMSVAGLIFLLFKLAEQDFNPRMRALATQWLIPKQGEVQIKTAEAFHQLFEAVFDTHHFSAKCFVRTVLIASLFSWTLIAIAELLIGPLIDWSVKSVLTILLFGATINTLGDYIALWKTRRLLGSFKEGGPLSTLLAVDAVASLLIFIVVVSLAVLVVLAIDYGNSIVVASDASHRRFTSFQDYLNTAGIDIAQILMQPYLQIFHPGSDQLLNRGSRLLLYVSFATHFMASVWLWAALLVSPLLRGLAWTRGAGLVMVAAVLDVHRAPFTALGYLCSMAAIVLGIIVWGVGEAVAFTVRSVGG